MSLADPSMFHSSERLRHTDMTFTATLRRLGGTVVLSIPEPIVESMAVDAGSVVEMSLTDRTLSVTPIRRSLADRLALSPSSPAQWLRDDDWLEDGSQGRESL